MIKTLIITYCTNFIGFHLGQKLLKKYNIIKILNIDLNIKLKDGLKKYWDWNLKYNFDI